MKYLRKFNTADEKSAWQIGAEHVMPNVTLTADTSSVEYNSPLIRGVFIQHIDGSLYTESEWTNGGFSNDVANGIAVIDSRASFVISKNQASQDYKWCSITSNLLSGVSTSLSEYNGKANTDYMAEVDTSGAAYYCTNFIFPNGQSGYLPSYRELRLAYEYKEDITNIISVVGGDSFINSLYWTSTQKGADQAYDFNWKTGYTGHDGYKWALCYVRAFTSL